MKTTLPNPNLYRVPAILLLWLLPLLGFSQGIAFGKNYFNVTRPVTGGTAPDSGRYASDNPDFIEGRFYCRIKATEGEGF